MSPENAISVKNVSKVYRIWSNPSQRLASPLLQKISSVFPSGSRPHQKLKAKAHAAYRDFYALQSLSFEVRKGEAFGIIGRNGSGKSTLLQILAGTLQPTDGQVGVEGRIAALLELGSGFNPEFTGRENVFLNGAVLGFNRREMEKRFDLITAFADIGDFIDQPVKTYSSGMMIRLAFAVQTVVEPDVLIVDEALSVGDFFFSQKCARRMTELREKGTTLLFVSHDMASVRDLTTRALLLEEGHPLFIGETQEAVARYFQLGDGPAKPPPAAQAVSEVVKPDSSAEEASFQHALWRDEAGAPEAPALIKAVAFFDQRGAPLTRLLLGQKAVVSLLIAARRECAFNAALEIKNRYDQVASSISTYGCSLPPVTLAAGALVRIDFTVTFNLEAGLYTLCAILGHPDARPNRGARLAATGWFGPLKIEWDYETERAPFLGMFGPPVYAQVRHL